MRLIYPLILVLSMTIAGHAQSKLFLSTQAGASLSHSEIDTRTAFQGQLGFEYMASKIVGIEASFRTGNLTGADGNFPERFNFNNRFNLLALQGNLYLHELLSKDHNSGIEIFATAGVGYLLSTVKEANSPQGSPATFNYDGGDIVFPVGAGLDFGVTEKTRFCLSLQYNFTLSDELNGYNPATPSNDDNDTFTFVTVGFKFGL